MQFNFITYNIPMSTSSENCSRVARSTAPESISDGRSETRTSGSSHASGGMSGNWSFIFSLIASNCSLLR